MRAVRAFMIVVIALALIGAFVWWTVPARPRSGGPTVLSAGVEQWCGAQLQRIANDHLGPELTFASFDYRFPTTVVLEDLELTAEGVSFITAGSATIELARLPKRGEPIVIEVVQLDRPQLRLVRRPEGGLIGFSGMVTGSSGSVSEDGGSTRPSDVFAIRRFDIADGSMRYEAGDRPPMVLDDLHMQLGVDPSDDEPGWYALAATLSRSPLLEMDLDARLNIDTALLVLGDSTLDMRLHEDQYKTLTPDLQMLLRQYAIVGDLNALVRGELPLRDAASGTLEIELRLADANMRFDDHDVPLESLVASTRLAGRQLVLDTVDARMLGGTVELDGSFDLTGERRVQLSVATDGIRLEEAVGSASHLTGATDLTGTITAALGSAQPTLQGNGHVDVTDGTIIDDPIVGGVGRRLGFTPGGTGNDRGSADLELSHDRIGFSNLNIVSPTFAARGEGEIRFDSSIDFTFNAGPIERLQEALGGLGQALGKLTDKVVDYEVTGTIDEPTVKARPFGIRY